MKRNQKPPTRDMAEFKKKREKEQWEKRMSIYKAMEEDDNAELKGVIQKKFNQDDSPRRKAFHLVDFMQQEQVPPSFECFFALPQMKYKNHAALKKVVRERIDAEKAAKQGTTSTELAEVFFGRRNRAKEERDKKSLKDLMLEQYADPFAAKASAKPHNQFNEKRDTFVDQDAVKQKAIEEAARRRKLSYKYKQRVDMPFWYDWAPDTYKEVLNEDDMLSIDDDHDPERGIEMTYFVLISRLLNFKESIMKFIELNKNKIRRDRIEKFRELLNNCDYTKQSQVPLDQLLLKKEYNDIRFQIERFILKFDIPIFKDKRLNDLDYEQQNHRSKIPRLQDLYDADDAEVVDRVYMPETQDIRFRVETATKQDVKDALNDIDIFRTHEMYTDISNNVLQEMKKKKKLKKEQFVDIQDEADLQKLQVKYARQRWNLKDEQKIAKAQHFNYGDEMYHKKRNDEFRERYVADLKKQQLEKQKKAKNLNKLRGRYTAIMKQQKVGHHLIDIREQEEGD